MPSFMVAARYGYNLSPLVPHLLKCIDPSKSGRHVVIGQMSSQIAFLYYLKSICLARIACTLASGFPFVLCNSL